MEIICENECKAIVQTSIEKSSSYDEYMKLMNLLVSTNSTTGNKYSAEAINFTKLNQRRMKRWNKTLKIPGELLESLKGFSRPVTWLVLTESWCGDAAHLLPAINKVASLSDKIKLRTVLRDENPELMGNFLTEGTKSIPKLIMIDDGTGKVVNTYGSRPEILTKIVRDYKELHGKLTPEFKEEIQNWYNKDKGQTIISELLELLHI